MDQIVTIVCLGWGSLIWRQDTLPVRGEWQPDGPVLPLEFARELNDKRITLVITPGAPMITALWAELDVKTLHEAKTALAAREGISEANIRRSIGAWSADAGSNDAIGHWATGQGFAHVVWTALKPKVGSEYRTPSAAEVLGHLASLAGEDRGRAEEYVRMAPRQIATPYRASIEQRLGWTPRGLI